MPSDRHAAKGIALLAIALLAAPPFVAAHEGHDEGDAANAASASAFPEGLILPDLDGPTPWSDKPNIAHPDRFHIAIMTDRTGGHRPGVWMQGVRGVNLMRPEFVVSVGDLIEGYSTNRQRVEAEWEEFLGFIDQLDMKFFFVAGNHDVTNPVMHDIWREHFGPEWYSFDYKGVHFLCLSSEDAHDEIGEKQLQWIENDLQENQDARWTLVFLHKPLWVYAERAMASGGEDPTNWKKVEQLLGARPHTVFSGHVHHYVQYDRNGMKYYHLATTGGGNRLRGVPYGEFDHVTWLTMEADGPHVAHLKLDGILAPDAVTEKGIARFRNFLAGSRIEVAPILLDDADGFSEGAIHLRLTNDFDTTVKVSGAIDGLPLRSLSVEPASLELSAAPGETSELAVVVRFGESVDFQHLAQTVFTAELRAADNDSPLYAERSVPVVIDRSHSCPAAAETITVDGALDEWGELGLATASEPLIVGDEGQWNGPGDASARFALAHDDRHVYLAARVLDDRVVDGGDALIVRLDARPINQRRFDPRLGRGTYTFTVTPPNGSGAATIEARGNRGSRRFDGAQAAGQRTSEGYDLEVAIPIEYLNSNQGDDWQNFQLSLTVDDRDDSDEDPVKILWRGTEAVDSRNTNYGHFVRGE